VEHAYASHAKLQCFFKPPPPVHLEEGLRRTFNYVTAHGSFEPTGFEDIEIRRNIPPSWAKALAEWKLRKAAKAEGGVEEAGAAV
jgi:hypothetical protein